MLYGVEPKKKIGRPPKPPELWAEVLDLVRHGMSYRRAALAVGISHQAIDEKRKRESDFLAALKKANAECEAYHLKRLYYGVDNWQSSAWSLRNVFKGRYLADIKAGKDSVDGDLKAYIEKANAALSKISGSGGADSGNS